MDPAVRDGALLLLAQLGPEKFELARIRVRSAKNVRSPWKYFCATCWEALKRRRKQGGPKGASNVACYEEYVPFDKRP